MFSIFNFDLDFLIKFQSSNLLYKNILPGRTASKVHKPAFFYQQTGLQKMKVPYHAWRIFCGLQKGLGRRLAFANRKKDFLTKYPPKNYGTRKIVVLIGLKDQTLLKESKIQRKVFETFNS
jgi:hypothetical protein